MARAKMSLSRAQNIFMPENINSIVILSRVVNVQILWGLNTLIFFISIITQVIIEILALSLAENSVIFRYNHLRRGDYSGRTNFQNIFDNIDGKLERRHMSKDKQNLDYHWVNHKIVINRVSGTNLDSSPRDLLAVPNITFLPSVKDQQLQRHNYIVLVSRILVDHLKCFGMLKDVCVRHIPHKYSKEMASKSESVSTFVNYY